MRRAVVWTVLVLEGLGALSVANAVVTPGMDVGLWFVLGGALVYWLVGESLEDRAWRGATVATVVGWLALYGWLSARMPGFTAMLLSVALGPAVLGAMLFWGWLAHRRHRRLLLAQEFSVPGSPPVASGRSGP